MTAFYKIFPICIIDHFIGQRDSVLCQFQENRLANACNTLFNPPNGMLLIYCWALQQFIYIAPYKIFCSAEISKLYATLSWVVLFITSGMWKNRQTYRSLQKQQLHWYSPAAHPPNLIAHNVTELLEYFTFNGAPETRPYSGLWNLPYQSTSTRSYMWVFSLFLLAQETEGH